MRPFTRIAAAIFAVICVAHVLRLVLGVEVTVAGAHVPLWVNAFGAVVTAGLAAMLWRESRQP